ncbi:MAG: hypothetical protein AB7F19_03190 [Candidatus Babeliales bacterium]
MKRIYMSFLLTICSILKAQELQFIDAIDLEDHKITYYVNQEFHTIYLRDNLFVEYEPDINLWDLDYTIITMPLIMNTIGMIWISGNDYVIDAMDKELYHSLELIRTIFRRFYPKTSFNGNLIPKKLVDNSPKPSANAAKIALPFSHGLDSLCTSLRLRKTPQLLITARGLPDTPLALWDRNWRFTIHSIEQYAALHGHTVSLLQTNFHEFFNWTYLCTLSPEIYNWRICMVEGLGWMGLTAPILVSKGYNKFILPANSDWTTAHPGADCPLINDNVTFAGIVIKSEGFELTRMEKNKLIANICNDEDLEKPFLMICENVLPRRKNCCQCEKCIASMLSFLLINEDPKQYGFNMPIPDFFDYVKSTFIPVTKLEDYPANWFKYCQQEAREKLTQMNSDEHAFFSWFITIDFDAITIPCNSITIDYSQFLDVYPYIPQSALQGKGRA